MTLEHQQQRSTLEPGMAAISQNKYQQKWPVTFFFLFICQIKRLQAKKKRSLKKGERISANNVEPFSFVVFYPPTWQIESEIYLPKCLIIKSLLETWMNLCLLKVTNIIYHEKHMRRHALCSSVHEYIRSIALTTNYTD